jgi:hypothetical protein
VAIVLTQGVAELLGIISIIAGLDHDGLSAGEAAGQDDNNFAVLDAVERRRSAKLAPCLTIVPEQHFAVQQNDLHSHFCSTNKVL